MTKPRILEAMREAKGDHAVQPIDHLKKGDTAREAELLLLDTGWLPEPLRTPDGEEAAAVETLPAFLDGDGSDAYNSEDPERFAIAAE